MRTCAFIVVLTATIAAGCGDNFDAPIDTTGTCGDGVVGPREQCDDGAENGAMGKPCTATCRWACETDAACDDGNACNGAETCRGHVCAAGTAPGDGASCGGDKICRSNTCVSASCGDRFVETGEECDGGPGCTAACKFLCTADPATQCAGTPAVPCQQFACAADHSCVTVADTSANGTGCDANQPDNVCVDGACKPPACGDGILELGEDCEIGDIGCRADCKFICNRDPDADCAGVMPAPGACEQFACTPTHTCEIVTEADGHSCTGGLNNFCSAGSCKAPTCGNSVVEPGEDCDGGAGCKADCTFVCGRDPATECAGTGTPAACEKFGCTANHTCTIVPNGARNGQACDATLPANVCFNGTCGPLPSCGNGTLDTGEQCDDGNLVNLDGCDSVCQFEEDQRITSLQQQFATDAFCQKNALGFAITPIAHQIIQNTWSVPVTDGSLSVVFKFLGLQDLTGRDTSFTLGFVKASAAGRVLVDAPTCGNGVCEESSTPGSSEFGGTNPSDTACPMDCAYDGNNDLDWWYVRDLASVDASETPLEQLSGQITGGHLTAGPGTISLNLLFALEPALVKLFDTKVDAQIDGAVTAPALSTTGTTPGHLASEHLLSTLTTVQGSTTGAMCSNVSAASLFNTPMPLLLRGLCTDATGQVAAFTTDNHLLEAFVAGCRLFGTPGIVPTQPDGSLDGATYRFALDPTTNVLTSCTKNGLPALLADCLSNATYSSYFQFAADRVIIKRN